MTRDEFLRRLNRGLAGAPADAIADITSDYEAHFDAAAEEGRNEAEVAAALGDPGRLARELKLEAGIKQWEERRSPGTAWTAVIAFLGLGALDIIVLLPILLSVGGMLIGFFAACIGVFIAGIAAMVVGPFAGFPGGGFVAILAGIGLMAISIFFGSLLSIATIWLVNFLMWFGRLHYRVIKPAIENDA